MITSLTGARPAAFLDRDGTLVVEKEFLADPDQIELIAGSAAAVKLLNEWGYWVIGVSNQSGVARGYFGEKTVQIMNGRVQELFSSHQAEIHQIYYCPHYPAVDVTPCLCRKPARGMVDQALHDFSIDLARSFVVGDHASDIQLAHNLGIPGILVLTGHGMVQQGLLGEDARPAHIAPTLYDAICWWERRREFD